jgi:hypothetical protein
MHLNEQFFHVSAERLLKAERNVEFAKRMPLIVATASESFAAKLKKAVAARRGMPSAMTRKQHEEQVERERARSRKPERRERTKGE